MPRPRFHFSPLLFLAGLAQIAATFAPAGHRRLLGDLSFAQIPSVGIAFIVLGVLTALAAFLPRGWWQWTTIPAFAVLLAVVYSRIRWQPAGNFTDPLVRRMVRPAWGFIPMALAVALTLVAALIGSRRRPAADEHSEMPEHA